MERGAPPSPPGGFATNPTPHSCLWWPFTPCAKVTGHCMLLTFVALYTMQWELKQNTVTMKQHCWHCKTLLATCNCHLKENCQHDATEERAVHQHQGRHHQTVWAQQIHLPDIPLLQCASLHCARCHQQVEGHGEDHRSPEDWLPMEAVLQVKLSQAATVTPKAT